MHAFDARLLAGHEIIVRPAAEGEKIVTLDEKERTLTATDLVIADGEKPVVIAGIMGGINSGVSADTTDLVLEVAVFERLGVRRTSRRLGLSSDSSYRYERSVDPHMLDEALHRFIDLILAHAGGKVAGPIRKVGSDIPWEREITVTPAYINEKLGFDIPADDIHAAFESLELTVVREEPTESRGPAWTLSIPSWRDDLDRPIDLVEEALRVYGTEKIPVSTVTAPGLVTDDDPIARFNRAVSAQLVGQSFVECVNYTLRSAAELGAWAGADQAAAFGLANPFVEDQSHLRSSLIGGLLDTLKLNQSRDVPAARLFETGRVFAERDSELTECVSVGFVFAEETGERAWRNREASDFYTAKRLIETLAGAAGIDFARQPLTPVANAGSPWQPGHAVTAGEIRHGWCASFGLVNLKLVKALGLTGQIYAGTVAVLPAKIGGAAAKKRYQPLNLMPAALRDLALVVDAGTTAGEVQKALTKIARAAVGNTFALEGVQVFDVYQGKGLPEDKKSLAFSLTFRAADRTLTDAEVNTVFTKIQDEAAAAGYQVRK
ncbi:MAG: phenylalanine--tRNA ligase subunit beta [Verrucomicrobiota bacterium]